MPRSARAVTALLAAGGVLWVTAWFDHIWLTDMQRQAGASFDPTGLMWALGVGSLAVAGAVLLVAILAWRSPSVAVSTVYAVVGAFFTFLPTLLWQFSASVNGAPPVLPQPVADVVTEVYQASTGPLNAVETVGAGMLIVGVAGFARAMRGRQLDRAFASVVRPETSPQPGSTIEA